ncbi:MULTISPECIES: K+/H+ antiporter subunit F [Methylophaga]|jgi:multicomponent K+:H+ antiporter subunit F|uniref:Multisubunit Na+/H+ antiporter, MnhF subunit n=3 Tax=Methylophaga TaxID=40222 RepID=F5T1R9_9GAMM|nr:MULTISPECIES: K+/H+ antiporter subunit F [Methylophaga]EGL53139.1 multisubunit Na+/H+ antiporter, MnhF subunit [Methylophaga aminisulfidivorans MP]MAX52755.1 K+/H+ antiporter subunit F [Methylophaga sp.]WVI84581.1 K+/H+ antiporter subunit F [Methylophaga thalassica]BDZ74814.1 monovalent cation/H+ antiporter subunit F [Methylophaga marina]GLP99653.1 monovalent cation/H+ antiporter subunit F [Methylophaga thalassica]|tara:strand:- start:6930 stop:7199 length:270 start_codon:yes stop_codon:yes gene_type:complete
MLNIAIITACVMVCTALLLSLYRLLIGPSVPDRILALDTLYINSIALLILLGIFLRSNLYYEAALLIALMGFMGTLALSKYLLRGDIME